MSKKNTPQSKNRRSRLPQNAPNLNFSPENNFELTGITPQQNRGIRFRPQSFEYQSQLAQPNQNQNPLYPNRPFVPPQRPYTDYRQEPSGSSYRPIMDFIYPSQPYQPYSPLRSTNLEMNLEDYMPEYPTQNYPTQDASMGQGSGHGSYHDSIPVEDDDNEKTDDAEEMSPIKPKQPPRRASKAKDKGKKPEASKEKGKKTVEPWTKAEEIALCRAWVYVSENCEMPAFQTNSRKKTKGSTTTSGSTQAPLNVQDVDDSDDEEETRESRPVGRDAGRKKSSSSSRGDQPSKSFVKSLAKTFFKFKPSKGEKGKSKEGLEDAYIRWREKELEMKREKLELQKKTMDLMTLSKRETDIIFYNTPVDPNLTPRQLEELMKVKATIKERYGLDY